MRNLFDITKDQILEDTTLSSLARPQDLPEDPPEWFKNMLNKRRRQSVSEYETILEWKKRKPEIQVGKHQSPQVGLTPLAVSEEARNRAQTVNKALVDFARIFPKEGAGLVLQLKGEKEFEPVTKLERLVFGDEPVLPLSKQGEEFLQGVGFSEAKAKSFGLPVGFAFLALDLLPGGGAKNVFRTLAKTKVLKNIITTLKKIGVVDDLLESTAKRIAKTSDEKGVAKILDEVDKEQVKKASGLIRTVEKGAEAELGLSRETREAVEKLLKKDPNNPIATNTEPRLFKRVAEGLRSGKVSADDIPMA